jgi:hypothetical protein
MKSLEELELELTVELISNAQKVPHLDTGGRGDHIPLALKVRRASSIEDASRILVEYENMRMTAVREAQRPRLELVKKRLKQFK